MDISRYLIAAVFALPVVFMPSTVRAQESLDFEMLANGDLPVDNQSAGDEYRNSHGIRFYLLHCGSIPADLPIPPNCDPTFEQRGNQVETAHGFRNDTLTVGALKVFDREDTQITESLGNFFLKAPSTSPDMVVEYLWGYPLAAEGDIWDIDFNEKWKVSALDANGGEIASLESGADDGGDGRPWTWVVSGSEPIHKILIRHIGPSAKPGLGFDRFVARKVPGPCSGVCCLGACCSRGGCMKTTDAYCSREGGDFRGVGSVCEVGRCVKDDLCYPTSRTYCLKDGGRYIGSKPCPIVKTRS